MRVIAVLTVAGTALAAAYLLRVLYRLWHGDAAVVPEAAVDDAERPAPGRDASPIELIVTVPLVLATTALGVLPWLLLDVTGPAVRTVLGLGRGSV